MVSLGVPALIAAGASFPTGFGFGAGYGTGVRAGYDIIYPHLSPFLKGIATSMLDLLPQTQGDKQTQPTPPDLGHRQPNPTSIDKGRTKTPPIEGSLGDRPSDPVTTPGRKGRTSLGQPSDTLKQLQERQQQLAQQIIDTVRKHASTFPKNNPNYYRDRNRQLRLRKQYESQLKQLRALEQQTSQAIKRLS